MALYGVMQKKRNSIADVLELRLFFFIKPSINRKCIYLYIWLYAK